VLALAASLGIMSAAAAATPLAVRVGDVLVPDFNTDAVSPEATPGAARIVAARGGTFSAKVLVTNAEAIRNLSAEVSALASGDRRLPASAARVRYALPWGTHMMPWKRGNELRYGPRPGFLGLLVEKPPAEFPATRIKPRRGPEKVYPPVVPVWVTVTVPAETAPGTYTGRLTLKATGHAPTVVPLEVTVVNWTVPKPADWRTWVEVLQSPETLAMEYDVPLWSEAHWKLVARSLRNLRDLGNRIVYIPLICRTNMGHEQSMVRWTKQADGSYRQDYAVMDRYLDTVEAQMGKPEMVVFYVWENYMIRKGQAGGAAADHEQERILKILEQKNLFVGKGPAVTVVDADGGNLRTEYLPHYTEAASHKLWQPVFAELKARLAKRGLGKAMMLGMINDCWPTKKEVQFFKDIANDMPWVLHAHFGRGNVYGLAKIGNQARVWHLAAPGATSLMGWKQPNLLSRFIRLASFDAAPLVTWRYWGEYCIAGNQRGVARLGADFWRVVKDKRGKRVGRIWNLYPESGWRNLDIYTSLLAPGPQGPEPTTRFEVFREGIQECEARIAIERMLSDDALRTSLPETLVARCREILDERLARMNETTYPRRTGFAWNLLDGWQGRSRKLYELAAEVAQATARASR
jgi:glycosyl hydrolase family 123